MAGPNQADVQAEHTMALLDIYRATGLLKVRVGWTGDGLGKVAKMAGTTPEVVAAWLAGELQPMPGQALALVRTLRLAGETAPAATSNGKAG